MRVGSVFSGHGALDFGLHLAGLEHGWFCESDPFRRDILSKRWPGVPIFEDIRGLGADDAGSIDVIAGGFPCRGISAAGKREGFGHPETVLWREMLRTIREFRPRYVIVENVRDLLVLRPPGGHPGDLWREVLGGLSASGFDAVWDVLPAAAFGAPHLRQRVVAIAAHSDRAGWEQRGGREPDTAQLPAAERTGPAAPNPNGQRRQQVPGGASGDEAADVGDGRLRPHADHELAGTGEGGVPAADAAPSDPDQRLLQTGRNGSGADGDQADSRGLAEWGEYGFAIERWERVHGPAPSPLIRRVDDGSSPGVVRSRLSALGDGVLVDLGITAGRYVLDLDREVADA